MKMAIAARFAVGQRAIGAYFGA